MEASQRTVSKRPHRKARTGCKTCKQRRIKCDEARPACKNCIKHSVQCDFTASNASTSASPSGYPAATGTGHGTPNSYGSEQDASRNDHSALTGTQEASSLRMEELELIHNYSTSTCFTLSYEPVLRTLWRVNVPQLAFPHDFVMRGILAVSALHLAHFNPERKNTYLLQAMTHHQIGLRTVSANMLSITKESGSAMYLFSVLTVIFALASPRKEDDFFFFAGNGTPKWVLLLQGTRSISDIAGSELRSGPLSPLFTSAARRFTIHHLMIPEFDHLAELRHLIKITVSDWKTSQIYSANIDILDESFKIIYSSGSHKAELADVFSWPYRVTEEYLLLLRQRTQEALSIFAYFGVLLKALDSYWWMNGWAVHLIRKIHSVLDEEHRLWIRWPIEEIGAVLNHDNAQQ